MPNKEWSVNAPDDRPSVLNVVRCKCPRCRRGDMFVSKNPYRLGQTLKMYDTCPVCGQYFNLEVGFYYGSSYVSYAMSVALSVASLIAWWLTIGLGLYDNRFVYWLGFNAVLLVVMQPLLMRLARSLWLFFFVRYDPDWRTTPAPKPERLNEDQQNNW